MLVSLFSRVKNTSIPYTSSPIDDVIEKIKKHPQKDYINLARKVGVKDIPTKGGYAFVSFDEWSKNSKNNELNESLSQLSDRHNLVFFHNGIPDKISKELKQCGIVVFNLKKVDNFVTFFSELSEKNFDFFFVDFVYNLKTKVVEIKEKNLYDYIKSNHIECVTWNCAVNGRRKKSEINNVSGYIYMDIDDFSIISQEKALAILKDNGLSFVKAAWKSFGQNGLGFLIKVDGLTVENFSSTWANYANRFKEDLNIIIDPATKDITRINVISYDEDIFVREDSACEPLVAVEEQKNTNVIQTGGLPSELHIGVLDYTFEKMYVDVENWNVSENRLSYHFYQRFFSKCNRMGIPLPNVLDFISNLDFEKYQLYSRKYNQNDVVAIAEQQYEYYSYQFGEYEIKQNDESDYVVLDLNKKYEGDTDLKLKNIFEKTSKKDDANHAKFFISCKNAGIFMQESLQFIDNIYGYDTNFRLTANEIYKNTKYKFGQILQLKKETIQKRREALIQTKKEEGFVPSTKKYTVNDAYNFVKNDNNINTLTKKYVNYCIAFGISENECFDYILNVNEKPEVGRYIKFYISEFYKQDNLGVRGGLFFIKDKEKIQIHPTPDITIKLANDKKLASLDLEPSNKEILWADTNMGKTTWVAGHRTERRIILVPITSVLENIAAKYGATVYYQNLKNVTEKDNMIVCTYTSFPSLFNLMSSWTTKYKEWSIFFDEHHNFAFSAEKSFRNSELNFILDNVHRFKSFYSMTGTYFPIAHPFFKNCTVKRVKWEEQPQKNLKLLYYKDKYEALLPRLVKGKKNIIFFQNKKEYGKLGDLITVLRNNGWNKIGLMNANEKGEEEYKKIVETEMIDENTEILICTSVAIEGMNILNTDVESLHFLTYMHPANIEQFANRFRNIIIPKMYVYFAESRKKMRNEKILDVLKMQEEIIENIRGILKYVSKPKNKFVDSICSYEAQKALMESLAKSNFIRKNGDEWDIDYLAIANAVFEEESEVAANNIEYLSEYLKEYGWTVEFEADTTKMKKKDKEALLLDAAKRREEFKGYCVELVETIIQEGEEQLLKYMVDDNKTIFSNMQHPNVEWDMRVKVLKLCKYMSFEDACILCERWATEENMSEDKFKQLLRQISIQLIKKLDIKKERVDIENPFVKKCLSFYNKTKNETKERYFTKQELIDFFNQSKQITERTKNIDEKYAIAIFNKYFEITPVLKEGELFYRLDGMNPTIDISILVEKMEEFGLESIETQKMFTEEEIEIHMNKIREPLPLLSKIKLDRNRAMRTINDFFDVVKVKEKKKKYYIIKSLVPSLLDDINLFVNQKNIQFYDTSENKLLLDELKATFR